MQVMGKGARVIDHGGQELFRKKINAFNSK